MLKLVLQMDAFDYGLQYPKFNFYLKKRAFKFVVCMQGFFMVGFWVFWFYFKVCYLSALNKYI